MNSQHPQKKLMRVRPGDEFTTKRNLNYFPGLSEITAGTQNLSMMLVRIPPGGKAEPHYHDGFEAGIYILEGKVDNLYGEGLKESVVTEKGDFLFIPPGVPHQPVNLSDTEPALAIVSRNIASEQEPVVLYDPEPTA
ncbi:MAG: cupin domain-containing protein [Nitrospina sp.]|nr:MAG: cupin domain-containing protein [Nitrospina sp.]TDJ57635.1 MAG: cupin domain-containing protein [Nitrospina sp.]